MLSEGVTARYQVCASYPRARLFPRYLFHPQVTLTLNPSPNPNPRALLFPRYLYHPHVTLTRTPLNPKPQPLNSHPNPNPNPYPMTMNCMWRLYAHAL